MRRNGPALLSVMVSQSGKLQEAYYPLSAHVQMKMSRLWQVVRACGPATAQVLWVHAQVGKQCMGICPSQDIELSVSSSRIAFVSMKAKIL
mmetsp:Transcript_957/g.1625  ORF Transcript_957/g.1625 Transcript_957/m.1625 type:complete len:91 (+) Transcript_957:208-480(+)